MSIIIFIIILGILIFVHELGHFLVAKKTGMRVDEFAIGFPPKIFSWTKGGTKYALNMIPFGGYVKIFGERAGLESGDKIIGLTKGDADLDFTNSSEALAVIKETPAPFVLETDRGGIEIPSKLSTEDGEVVGIFLDDAVNTQTGFFHSFVQGYYLTGFSLTEITIALGDLLFDSFRGEAELENVAGPVGIVGMVGDAAESGIVSLIIFTAFISINLAIINLVPFPALDGGRLLFILIEVITRRPINYKVANYLNLIGFLILILLMIVITVSDIGKLF
jgi:regulator of sigma E protease